MAEETKIELVFDERTNSFRIGRDRPRLEGNVSYANLSKVFLSEEDLGKIPDSKFLYDENGKVVGAKVNIKSLTNLSKEKLGMPVKEPVIKELTYSELKNIREGESKLEDVKFSYKEGIQLSKELIDSGTIVQDPMTGRISFVTPTETETGEELAAGGTQNQTYAVVIPEVARYGGTVAMVYDAVAAQDNIIKTLASQNKIADYKRMLAEKGFYRLSGFNQVQIEQSISQGDTEDSFFRTAMSGFLYQYSIENFSKFNRNESLFEYDDYLNNYKPDYTTEDAYIPSEMNSEDALRAAYLQYVGRMPTDLELNAFKNAVESYAMSNPRRSGINDSTGMGVTQEGFTPDQIERFAQEYTLETPEAKQFGEGMGGYNMFNNAINSLIKDLENEVSIINKPALGTRPDGL
jgi:hypothetical protein